jgi:diadenosine tetraphosphate (Ap4A) HIT family hydrolase
MKEGIMARFVTDERIEKGSTLLMPLVISDLRLMDDSRFPWLMLVPRREGATEIIDLPRVDQTLLLAEIETVSRALKSVSQCDKLNIAAIGNVVPQLHVHIVARFRKDAAWPSPVWGFGTAVAYRAEERDNLVSRLKAALPA